MLRSFIKHAMEYVRLGGITYVKINQTHSEKLLENKNVVITGGTSGIGYEIAKKVIDLGGNVLITGRKIDTLEKIGNELNCKILEWDISDVNIAQEKIKKIVEEFDGNIDCFINNAGIFSRQKYDDCTIEEWDKIMNTNLKGLYFATQEVIRQCFEQKGEGNIIMMASMAGIAGHAGPYDVSKAGIIYLTKSLGKKLIGKNIRVNALAPGVTCSNINPIDENGNLYRGHLNGKRILSAKEIADIAVFLISDSSKCMTGQIFSCDNGETLL